MFKPIAFAAAVLGLALVAAQPSLAQPLPEGPQTTAAQQAANKTLVLAFWHDVFDAQDVSKAKNYLAPGENGYIQHNPTVPGGLAGFEAAFGKIFSKPKAPADVKRSEFDVVMTDRDLVLLMAKRPRPDPTAPGKMYISYWFDLFRVKDGKIVEHWDGALKTPPAAPPAG